MFEDFRGSVGLMLSKLVANSAVRAFTLEPSFRFHSDRVVNLRCHTVSFHPTLYYFIIFQPLFLIEPGKAILTNVSKILTDNIYVL